MQTIPVRTPELTLSLEQAGQVRQRVYAVDLLRGLVMVLMALQHVRVWFSAAPFASADLSRVPAGVFLTRWVTQGCAPVFALLAGASAYLALARGHTARDQARFLALRGALLVLLELTVVRLMWTFNLDYAGQPLVLQSLWAIGVAMVALGGLMALPLPLVGAVGVALVVGHDLLDGVNPAALGAWSGLFRLLLAPGPVELGGGLRVLVLSPVLPWIGVMALGYALGPVLVAGEEGRQRTLVRLGTAITAGFLLLRAWNGYGDPARWTIYSDAGRTALSFFDTTGAPASLAFLLMTLGPALLFLGAADRWRGLAGEVLAVLGRVPLFYYVLHLGLIHALALVIGTLAGFEPRALLTAWPFLPAGWGYGLPVVFALWAAVVLALYPACRWFAAVKATSPGRWLRYL
jgi:uncharacterized membrane protein